MIKPESCFLSGCPLAKCKSCGGGPSSHRGEFDALDIGSLTSCRTYDPKGKGFGLGYGDPVTAKYGLLLEALGSNEVAYSLRHGLFNNEDRNEIARRKRDYPSLPTAVIEHGSALVGASWFLLQKWGLNRFGITRRDLFIDNVLRCQPEKNKDGLHYPTGDDRKQAEACCRQYDRWDLFKPDVSIMTFHPASLMRSIVPLPLFVRSLEKLRDAAASGFRPVLLAGGKATKAWLGYWEGVEKHQGHYVVSKKIMVGVNEGTGKVKRKANGGGRRNLSLFDNPEVSA